jgi:hypothetical protein
MGWLVLDIWIAFLIHTIVNAWRRVTSAGWPIHSGKIVNFHYEKSSVGCDYGEYRYQYSVDGTMYGGIHRDPYFISRSRAARQSNSVGSEVQVRVSSADPAKSVLMHF